jgi:D-xylose transport system substrate-binding protein
MTIFKNVSLEADAATKLSAALIAGKDPAAAGLTLAPFKDPQAASHKLQALLLPAQVITQANIQDVIDAGALTKAEICKGIESDCAKIGLN